ncbi:hypothetical protein HUU40_25120 [candidate division KSB1 bacterium]|nr:hypothetical protein [candidate division KSB1 bacterium]
MKKMDNHTQDILILSLLFILLCVGWGFFNFVAGGGNNQFSRNAQAAVEAQGYTDVVPLGMDYVNCNRQGERIAGYVFEATNANGARVQLTACKDTGLLMPFGGWYILTR